MKRFLLTLILTLGLTLSTFSQYVANQYYAVRGATRTEVTYRQEYNQYFGRMEAVKYCRQTYWEQRRYSGNVYYYNQVYGTWYTRWESGTFWYCYWSGWFRC
jgi:hypothetical protein